MYTSKSTIWPSKISAEKEFISEKEFLDTPDDLDKIVKKMDKELLQMLKKEGYEFHSSTLDISSWMDCCFREYSNRKFVTRRCVKHRENPFAITIIIGMIGGHRID